MGFVGDGLKDCPKCGEWKPFGEFSPDKRGRLGLKNHCKACVRVTSKGYYDRVVGPRLAASRPARDAKREAEKIARQPAQDARRKEFKRRYMKAYRVDKPDVLKDWVESNRARYNSIKGARKAAQLQATPGWADKKAIDQYYLIANFLSEELGIEFHVDHIVPLRSDIVQGFHAQGNLAVLPGFVNQGKSNCRWPDMPQAA